VPAFVGLAILLFLPSLMVASVSLLKESLYSLVAAALVVSVLWGLRKAAEHRWSLVVLATGAAALCLWLLNDLRRGALVLAVAGLAVAAVIRLCAGSRPRALAVIALAVVGLAAILIQPSLKAAALTNVAQVARLHAGHVFTVGHSYKLLDAGFYRNPGEASALDLTLTVPQAARFLVRAAISFVVVPWPWELRSRGELAFMPELLLWYLMVAALPAGCIAAWRLDRTTASVLVGSILPTAAVLAVTTGNVGTLLRLRGVIIPSMVWLSAIGFCAVGQWLLTRNQQARGPAPRLAEAVQP
jgi:hypothetical protein